MKDEGSVDEYLGFAKRKLEEREQDEADLDDAAYEGSWYQLLKRRVDTDGDEEHP